MYQRSDCGVIDLLNGLQRSCIEGWQIGCLSVFGHLLRPLCTRDHTTDSLEGENPLKGKLGQCDACWHKQSQAFNGG